MRLNQPVCEFLVLYKYLYGNNNRIFESESLWSFHSKTLPANHIVVNIVERQSLGGLYLFYFAVLDAMQVIGFDVNAHTNK